MPDKLWSDCGDEFNSDLCEILNVEIATGPGYTPTSNAIVETSRGSRQDPGENVRGKAKHESSRNFRIGNTCTQLISWNLWLESIPVNVWQESKTSGCRRRQTSSSHRVITSHLNNQLSA